MSGDGTGWFWHYCEPCAMRVTQTHECPHATTTPTTEALRAPESRQA